jgi:hypothetical protein
MPSWSQVTCLTTLGTPKGRTHSLASLALAERAIRSHPIHSHAAPQIVAGIALSGRKVQVNCAPSRVRSNPPQQLPLADALPRTPRSTGGGVLRKGVSHVGVKEAAA